MEKLVKYSGHRSGVKISTDSSPFYHLGTLFWWARRAEPHMAHTIPYQVFRSRSVIGHLPIPFTLFEELELRTAQFF